MTYAGSLPQGQQPFTGGQPEQQQGQNQNQQYAPQQGYQGFPQQPQQQPQQYGFPSQQLPYDYNNYAHLQQAQTQVQPQAQQQHQQQHQQLQGQNQWGGYYGAGAYGNAGGGGGMQMTGAEQYIAPSNVWQHRQQQGFHVPSPQMAQQNMIPQAQFQHQGQVSSQQMAHLQQPPRRSPSVSQQRLQQQQQPHPRVSQHPQVQPNVGQQSRASPSMSHQQQPNAQAPPQLQHQQRQYHQQYQQLHGQPRLQQNPELSPSISQQQYTATSTTTSGSTSPFPQQQQLQAPAQFQSQPRPNQREQQQAQDLQPRQPQTKPQIQRQTRPSPVSHVHQNVQPQPPPRASQAQAPSQPGNTDWKYQPAHQEQVQFVNLHDIQQSSFAAPPAAVKQPPSGGSSARAASLQPAAIIKKSPSTTPSLSHIPLKKSEFTKPHQSPRVSTSQSPVTPVGRISSKSPAVSSKPSPYNATPMMVALAEEFISKARAAAPSIAASLQPDEVEEYQKMIGTALGCFEAALQSQRLSPRQEARVRLRYAAILQEETENIMEAETTLSKGITLCDKHRMLDLKYCTQYLMMKALSQRNRKAALKALDQHISDCDAYKHIHWAYAFRLLKTSFYMETGSTADATSLENIRSIQTIATNRGDSALSVYASLSEALILLKTSRGTPEMVQNCLAQASKYQLDPQVKVPQLELMYLLVDYLSSLQREKQDAIVERLRRLQKKIDECRGLASKAEFLVPIKKHPSASQTIGNDVSAIIRPGNGEGGFDYLVISFMTQMELTVLVFTMAGLTYLHKPSSISTADLWRQGLNILTHWEQSTKRSGTAALPLSQVIKKREWRSDLQCYLNLLLGLLSASSCLWDAVKHHLKAAEIAKTHSALGSALNPFFVYLNGTYCQGIGDFDSALSYYQDECFSLRAAHPKESQRHLALLAAMNRLWIMQRQSHQNNLVTMELLNELEPLCREHYNIEIRGAWSSVKATVVTNPPRQRNQRKDDAGKALTDVQASMNALAITTGLVIARDLLYNNLLGDQPWKCMKAAARWAAKSHNPLWQSVVDGILADFSEARNEKENAKMFWDKGVQEAKLAFARSS